MEEDVEGVSEELKTEYARQQEIYTKMVERRRAREAQKKAMRSIELHERQGNKIHMEDAICFLCSKHWFGPPFKYSPPAHALLQKN